MTQDSRIPLNVVIALRRIEGRLPDLIGQEKWESVSEEITARLSRLKENLSAPEITILTTEIVSILTIFPAAREQLNLEIKVQSLLQNAVIDDLAKIADQINISAPNVDAAAPIAQLAVGWTFDQAQEPIADEIQERRLTLTPGGIGGAKSVKFSNMDLRAIASK